MNKQRRNLILSRREMVQKEREEVREKLWTELKKGQKRKGVVKGVIHSGLDAIPLPEGRGLKYPQGRSVTGSCPS